jgi:hypothetical protein
LSCQPVPRAGSFEGRDAARPLSSRAKPCRNGGGYS